MAEFLLDFDPNTFQPETLTSQVTDFLLEYHFDELCANKQEYFQLTIDVSDLVHFDSALAFLIHHHPDLILPVFETECEKIQSKQLERQGIANSGGSDGNAISGGSGKSKWKVCFRQLPPFTESTKLTIREVYESQANTTALLQVMGTVVKVGSVKMLEVSKTYQCLKRNCNHEFTVLADPEQNFLMPQPSSCPAQDPRKPAGVLCRFSGLRESVGRRVCLDFQEIRLYDKVEHLSLGFVPRSIVVFLEGDLVNKVNPGDDVMVVGSVLRQWQPLFKQQRCGLDIVLRANNIYPLYADDSTPSVAAASSSGVMSIERPIATNNATNSLRQRDMILSSFCPQLFGLYDLKLASLLSLIGGTPSTATNRRSMVHLLMVGDPGSGKSQLLRYAHQVIDRAVFTTGIGSTGAGLTCTAQRDSSNSSSSSASGWSLEAGALVLASGGVCCIDEFSSMKEHDRVAIHEAMEQQTISVAKAGMLVKLDAKCTVIAACNPHKARFDPLLDMTSNTNIAPPLLSRFDMVYVLLDRPDKVWDKNVSTFLLRRATAASSSLGQAAAAAANPEAYGVKELRQFITHVQRTYHPEVSHAAFILLNRYYHIRRQQQGQGNDGQSTVRLIESLIRVSQAHARLMQRHEVTVMDAIIAIHLISRCQLTCSQQTLLGDNSSSTGGRDEFPQDSMVHYEEVEKKVLGMLNYSRKRLEEDLKEQGRTMPTNDDDSSIAASGNKRQHEDESQQQPRKVVVHADSSSENKPPPTAIPLPMLPPPLPLSSMRQTLSVPPQILLVQSQSASSQTKSAVVHQQQQQQLLQQVVKASNNSMWSQQASQRRILQAMTEDDSMDDFY